MRRSFLLGMQDSFQGLKYDNKDLRTGPKGNSEFCFPEILNASRFPTEKSKKKTSKNRLVDPGRDNKFAVVSRSMHDLITCESKVQVGGIVSLGS